LLRWQQFDLPAIKPGIPPGGTLPENRPEDFEFRGR